MADLKTAHLDAKSFRHLTRTHKSQSLTSLGTHVLLGAKPKVISDNKKVYERNMTHNVTDILHIK